MRLQTISLYGFCELDLALGEVVQTHSDGQLVECGDLTQEFALDVDGEQFQHQQDAWRV